MMRYFTLSMIIRYLAVLFVYVWGGIEIYQQIRESKRNLGPQNQDQGSLRRLYGAIVLGYAISIPFAFFTFGRITWGAPYLALGGLLVIGAGVGVRFWAMRTLRRHFTYAVSIQAEHELIEQGLYRYIRHPAYLGELLVFLGIGLAFANWVSLASLVVFPFVAFSLRMQVEEKALRAHFADRYTAYCRRTWRLIPGLY